MVIFPIALPGIVTGMALSATFGAFDVSLAIWTIVVGHATFCVVLVYNNAIARLRRTVALDRGGVGRPRGHTWQTFRYVTLPVLRTRRWWPAACWPSLSRSTR